MSSSRRSRRWALVATVGSGGRPRTPHSRSNCASLPTATTMSPSAALKAWYGHDVGVGVAVTDRLPAGGEVVAQHVDQAADSGLHQADLDPFHAATANQRGERPDGALQAGQHVEQRHPDLGGRAVRGPGDRHQAAHRLGQQVVRRPVGIGAGKSADGSDHQVRVARAKSIGIDAEASGGGRTVVVDQQVGGGEEPIEIAAAVRRAQVQDHAALVAVHRCEVRAAPIGRVAPPRRPPAPRLVASGWLDLDDVRPQVAEQHRGERTGQHAAEVHDADPVEREGIGHPDTVPGALARRPLAWSA